MKRILSIILTVAMLLSSISAFANAYPADKASAYVLDSEFAQQTVGNFKSSTGKGGVNVSGMFGKDADDVSGLYAEPAGGKYYYIAYNHNEPIYMDNGSELDGKLVLEFNFKAVNNDFTFAQIAISNRQRTGSEQINPNTAGYNPYGWNHVKWVYDPAGHGDFNTIGADGKYVVEDGAVLGTTVTYLNGVQLGNAPKTIVNKNVDSGIFNNGANEVLIQIYSGDVENVHSAYIDDVKVYKEAAPAAVAPVTLVAGNTYAVNQFTVLPASATTVADIKAANPSYEIKAFADNTFNTALADTDAIEIENYIVAKSADGVYGTYRVADPMEASYLVNLKDGDIGGKGVSNVRYAVEKETGVGGKLTTDTSAKITHLHDEKNPNDWSSYIGYASYTNTDKTRYFVTEFNFYPETATSLFIATAKNTGIVKGMGIDVLKSKQWNKIAMYVDYNGENPVGHLFVNGVELEGHMIEQTLEGRKFGVDAHDIRIGYQCPKDDAQIAYIDDVKIYETDKLPTADLTKAPVLVSNDKVTIKDMVIKTELGATVADLQADTAAVINAVNAQGEVTQSLTDGAKVAVIGKNAAINRYTVDIKKDTTEIKNITSYAEYVDAKLANPRANASEVLGFGGKEADDSAIKFAQKGTPENANSSHYDWYIQDTWGTTTKPTETTEATWDKFDFSGYFVFEAEIYNQSLTSIQFVTDQGSQVSTAFNVPFGKWSKVVLVVNESGDENDGKAIVYVDGAKVTGWTAHAFGTLHSTANTIKNSIRIIAKGIKNEKDKDYSTVTDFGTAYIDNYKMYESNIFPDIESKEDVNTVVVEGNPSKWVRGVIEEVDGFAGKTADNKVFKVTLTADASEDTAYSEVTWNRISEDSNYLVIQSEVYSASNYGGVYYATAQHSPLGANIANGSGIMGADKWNSYIVVIDLNEGYTADVYLNGKLVQEACETAFMTVYGNNNIRNLIRMVYPLKAGEASYFDNYKVYETEDYPAILESPVAENGVYENGVLTDNYLYVAQGTTCDEASVVLNKKACVYIDNTFELEEMGTAEVQTGYVAAIIDANNGVTYSRKIVVVDELPALGDSEFVVLAEGDSTTNPITIVANAKADDVLVVKREWNQKKKVVDEAGEESFKSLSGTSTSLLNIFEEDEMFIKTIVPNKDNGKYRVFMFDNMTSLRPLGAQSIIELPFDVKVIE